jgi:hypothetical protein
MDQNICNAILSRRCIAYSVADTGEARCADPFAYGITQNDEEAIVLWQWEATRSGSTVPGAWELVRLAEMHGVLVLEKTFETPRLVLCPVSS